MLPANDNDEQLYAANQEKLKKETEELKKSNIVHVDYYNESSSDDEDMKTQEPKEFEVGDNDEQFYAAAKKKMKKESDRIAKSDIVHVDYENQESSDEEDANMAEVETKQDFDVNGDSDEQLYAAVQKQIKKESAIIKNSEIVHVEYANSSDDDDTEPTKSSSNEPRKVAKKSKPFKGITLSVEEKNAKKQANLKLAVAKPQTGMPKLAPSKYVYSKDPNMVYGAKPKTQPVYEEEEKIACIEFGNMSNQDKTVSSGEIKGGDVKISSLKDCKLYILDICRDVSISNCSGCEIVVGAIEGDLIVDNCDSSNLTVACMQIKIRGSKQCSIQAFISTYGIIEESSNITFSQWNLDYKESSEHFEKAGFDKDSNFWNIISDTSDGDSTYPEPHFTLVDTLPPLRTI